MLAEFGGKGECLVKVRSNEFGVRSGEPEKIDGETKEPMGRWGDY